MKLFLSIILLLTTLATHAATPTNNVPISQMPITTNVIDNAYFPLIQPYPGRTTNDNFRATTATIFTGRGTGTFTNIYVTNLFVTNLIMLAGTNVASVNPTIGRIPYKDTTNTFGDSALFFIDTNTVGAVEMDTGTIGVSNLVTGGFVISVDSGFGYGILTNAPFSNFTHWTNISGLLQPIDLTLQNMVNNGWYIGTNSPGFYGPLAGDSLVTFHNTALGDPNYANIQQIVSDSAGTSGRYSLFTVNQDTGYTAFRMDTAIGSTNTARFALGSTTSGGTNRAQLELFLPARGDPSLIMTRLDPEGFFGGVPYLFDTPSTASTNLAQFANNGTNQFTIAAITGIGAADGSKFFANDGTFHSSSGAGTTINATDTYLPARLNSSTFTNSPLYTVNGTNWGFDQLMYLGPTNIVGRRNSDLTYTNLNAQAFGLKIGHSVGGEAHFLASSSGTLITSGNANFPVTLEAGGGTPVIVNPANFYPNGTMQLGSNGSPGAWTNLWMTGVLNVQGTNDGSGHFNRLALSNNGTNNIIDSQASATGAGLPLAQSYRIGGTNIFTIDATSGASTTGLLIYENGTAQRVTIGAADSGGAGFRVLRIPN